jgi:hypothetical protein
MATQILMTSGRYAMQPDSPGQHAPEIAETPAAAQVGTTFPEVRLSNSSNYLQGGKSMPPILVPEKVVKGGKVNYYLVHVEHPQRTEQEPYQAECEDIIEALGLTFNEANIFKEIWRSANARNHGNGKPGHSALYGAQKMVHYAGRILRKHEIAADKEKQMSQCQENSASTDW